MPGSRAESPSAQACAATTSIARVVPSAVEQLEPSAAPALAFWTSETGSRASSYYSAPCSGPSSSERDAAAPARTAASWIGDSSEAPFRDSFLDSCQPDSCACWMDSWPEPGSSSSVASGDQLYGVTQKIEWAVGIQK